MRTDPRLGLLVSPHGGRHVTGSACRLAEELGVTDIWVAEVAPHDPVAELLRLAYEFPALRFGLAGVGVATRHPLMAAEAIATTASIVGDRWLGATLVPGAPVAVRHRYGLDPLASFDRVRHVVEAAEAHDLGSLGLGVGGMGLGGWRAACDLGLPLHGLCLSAAAVRSLEKEVGARPPQVVSLPMASGSSATAVARRGRAVEYYAGYASVRRLHALMAGDGDVAVVDPVTIAPESGPGGLPAAVVDLWAIGCPVVLYPHLDNDADVAMAELREIVSSVPRAVP